MKRFISIIAAVLVTLLAGCASVPSSNDDLFSEARTYNGGTE
jgi:outer membrane murein-binding lipoprotein Lpp